MAYTDDQLKALDAIFYQEFKTAGLIVQNGGAISGTSLPTVNGFANFDGVAAQKILYPQQKLRPRCGEFTIITKFRIKTLAPFGRAVCGHDTSGTYKTMIWVDWTGAFHRLQGYIRTSAGAVVVGPYDNLDTLEHIAVLTYNRASSPRLKLYLDKLAPKTVVGADYDVSQPTVGLEIGQAAGASLPIEVYYTLVSSRAWSQAEINDWVDGTTFNYEDSCLLFCPMVDKIGSAAPFTTSDLSRTKATVTLGDGANAATFPAKLASRNGFSYDGGDYLNCSDSSIFTFPLSKFSVLFWGTSNSANGAFIGKYLSPTAREWMFGLASGQIYFWVYDQVAAAYRGRTSPVGFAYSQNNCYIGTYDGGILSSGLKLFLNAKQVDTANYEAGAFVTMRDTSQPVLIGSGGGGLSNLTGKSFLSALFARELTLTQAKDLYVKGSLWVPGTYQM